MKRASMIRRMAAPAAALGLTWCAVTVPAQMLGELEAAQSGFNTLNQQSVGPIGGNPLGAARAVAGQQAPYASAQPGAPFPGAIPGAPGFAPIEEPKITVITGTRVFDAVSGFLLDDAQMKRVPATEQGNYYDDGTHGDLEPEDGIFTFVEDRNDVIGQSNQRVKEQLVRALQLADEYTPQQFFGLRLLTLQRTVAAPRTRAWAMTRDPNGVGHMLEEREVEQPVTVPNYRDKQMEKDSRIKNDWAFRFLQEYRVNKDSLTSDFYSMYVPQPPPLPAVAPPPGVQWRPFSDPQSLLRQQQASMQGGSQLGLGGGDGMGMDAGGAVGGGGGGGGIE